MTFPKVRRYDIFFRFPIDTDRLQLTVLLLGAFYMVGDIESARAKGEKILAELEGK